ACAYLAEIGHVHAHGQTAHGAGGTAPAGRRQRCAVPATDGAGAAGRFWRAAGCPPAAACAGTHRTRALNPVRRRVAIAAFRYYLIASPPPACATQKQRRPGNPGLRGNARIFRQTYLPSTALAAATTAPVVMPKCLYSW